jgi:dipeptidyl aminopeptidase/acylaminoacyl peptidase
MPLAVRGPLSLASILLAVLMNGTAGAAALSLDDIFGEVGARDVAISPSGRYLACIVRKSDGDVIIVEDLQSGSRKVVLGAGTKDLGPQFDSRVNTVLWKTDERLLFRLSITPADGVSWSSLRLNGIRKLGNRLFALDRDGKNLVRMLADNHENALNWAMDLGAIRSMMPRDPHHILMVVDGQGGRSLYKVDVRSGAGEIAERPNLDVVDWWIDLDGVPIVRVSVGGGTLRFYRREKGERWKKYYSVRLRELKEQNEYEPVGASDVPDKYYVLARPEGAQRRGVYLYDLVNESFGPPLAENANFDITSANISTDGKRVMRFCYLAHVRICETSDANVNAHMKGVRKYFKDSANVYVYDSSEDGQTLLLFVEGPSDPPAYYRYQVAAKNIQLVGHIAESMANKTLPTAKLIEYQSRDGTKLTGYLTRPPGAENAAGLPLVMMPHGGPEARDHLTFDPYVQYLAARGYAVFQPNFRGSDGFGRAFTESGYGQWGRKMQDDISDAVALLVADKTVDPARVCIVGASYGGYAALAGAALTPDLYKCAVSIAGIADLSAFLKTRRTLHGKKSELYSYWKKQIGDPDKDAERIAAVSPVLHVDSIKAPILLVHGDADEIVPFAQSVQMKKLLDKSGRKTELIELEDEGHSEWSEKDERQVLTAVADFLQTSIGPGYQAIQETTK